MQQGPRATRLFNSQAMGATVSSGPLNVQQYDNVAVQAVWTGTPVGTVGVECSLDYDPTSGNAGTWSALSGASVAAGGAAGSQLFDLNQLGAPWLRLTFTFTSGSGTLQGYAFSKGISG